MWDVGLSYETSGGTDLYLWVEVEGDITLLISAPHIALPDGVWECDITYGNGHPFFVFPNARDGLYAIGVGSHNNESHEATLHISESDPRPRQG